MNAFFIYIPGFLFFVIVIFLFFSRFFLLLFVVHLFSPPICNAPVTFSSVGLLFKWMQGEYMGRVWNRRKRMLGGNAMC